MLSHLTFAEVTELFNRNKIEDAIAKTLRDYSGGSTDYGQALLDFKKLCLDDVDNRTTIIILGDARNNFGEAHAEVLKELYDRSKTRDLAQPRSSFSLNTGDSEMRKYGAYSPIRLRNVILLCTLNALWVIYCVR